MPKKSTFEDRVNRTTEQLIQQAVDLCFGPQNLWWEAAYWLLGQQVGRTNQDLALEIKSPSKQEFYNRLLSDPRSPSNPWIWGLQGPIRPPRDLAKDKRRRELWYDACELFLDIRSSGQSIDGEIPTLSQRSLKRVLPALNRAVGGEREGIEPPSIRWFLRQVSHLARSEAD